MKKVMLVALLMAMAVMSVCQAVVAETAEDVTLRFIHIWPEHQETMEKSVELIEEKYGFNIELSVVPWNEITNLVQISLASDDMYDVFFSWGGQIPGYNQSGVVLDLTPYFDADTEWKDSFISESVFRDNSYEVDDKIYGIPFRGTGSFIIYNKTMFEEKGYAIPSTQEELVSLMDKMLKDDIIPIATEGTPHGGKVEYVRRSLMDYLLLDAGIIGTEEHLNGRLLDYQGLRGESAEMTREWYKKGYFGENPFGTEREEAQTLFFSGKAGLLWCNNNELTDLRELESQFGIEVDSFQWPSPEGAGVTIGYAGMNDGFAAWAGTKYPDQAADLLKGLTMMDVQTLWGDKANSIMCVQGISYSDSLLVKWSEEFSDMTRYVVAGDYNMGTQDDDVSDIFVDFMLSDMTPEEYEAKFVDIRTKSIADAEGND